MAHRTSQLTAIRHRVRWMEIAELAIADRDAGVVGFDIAGAEAGFPPTRHLDAFEYLQSPDERHLDDSRTRPARRRLRPARLRPGPRR